MKAIIFNPEMVVAILGGDKTQTRRCLKTKKNAWLCCPYGKIGGRLWVRETHYVYGHWAKAGTTKTGKQKWMFVRSKEIQAVYYANTVPGDLKIRLNSYREHGWYKRPGMFMFREDSRINLEITNINVQRVQDITNEDAKAEGVHPPAPHRCGKSGYGDCYPCAFKHVWNIINQTRETCWHFNPWVWVIIFKVLPPQKNKRYLERKITHGPAL